MANLDLTRLVNVALLLPKINDLRSLLKHALLWPRLVLIVTNEEKESETEESN